MGNNIRVAVRVKPHEHNAWNIDRSTGRITRPSCPSFTFDRLYADTDTTSQIYRDVASDIVEGALSGTNGSILAYGQTGSGKTFTMSGTDDNPGIVPLAVNDIFSKISTRTTHEFLVATSYFEIYNEKVYDLVVPGPALEGCGRATVHLVSSPNELMSLIKAAESRRRIGATAMNERSSRSHSVLRLSIESRSKTGDRAVFQSFLDLVDLAGSEGVRATGAEGDRLREASAINKSLLALARVIGAIVRGGPKSFRESRLTLLLKDSLGGNARSAIIATIDSSETQKASSEYTLRFASCAMRIENKPVVNRVEAASATIERLVNEIGSLKRELEALKASGAERSEIDSGASRLQKLKASLMNAGGRTRRMTLPPPILPVLVPGIDYGETHKVEAGPVQINTKTDTSPEEEELIVLPARKKTSRVSIVNDVQLISAIKSPPTTPEKKRQTPFMVMESPGGPTTVVLAPVQISDEEDVEDIKDGSAAEDPFEESSQHSDDNNNNTDDLDTIKNENESLKQEIQKLTLKSYQYSQESQNLRASLDSLRTELQQAMSKIDESQQEIDSLILECQHLRNERDDAFGKLGESASLLENRVLEIPLLDARKEEELRHQYEDQLRSRAAEILSLKKSLHSLQNAANAAIKERDSALEEIRLIKHVEETMASSPAVRSERLSDSVIPLKKKLELLRKGASRAKGSKPSLDIETSSSLSFPELETVNSPISPSLESQTSDIPHSSLKIEATIQNSEKEMNKAIINPRVSLGKFDVSFFIFVSLVLLFFSFTLAQQTINK